MKFRFRDWVVCTDSFYQTLQAPGAKEGAANKRNPAMGVVEDYKASGKKITYLVRFDTGPSKWIAEEFLELYSQRDFI